MHKLCDTLTKKTQTNYDDALNIEIESKLWVNKRVTILSAFTFDSVVNFSRANNVVTSLKFCTGITFNFYKTERFTFT